jgi:hypothetical protein
VFSLGLIEHFENHAAVLDRLQALLRPGGTLITIVPNLVGVWGAIQKRLDPEIYRVHVPYTPSDLDRVHRSAGLRPIEPATYFGVFGPLILNSGRLRRSWPRAHRTIQSLLWIPQQVVGWSAFTLLGRHAETRLLSSHVVGVYRSDGH